MWRVYVELQAEASAAAAAEAAKRGRGGPARRNVSPTRHGPPAEVAASAPDAVITRAELKSAAATVAAARSTGVVRRPKTPGSVTMPQASPSLSPGADAADAKASPRSPRRSEV